MVLSAYWYFAIIISIAVLMSWAMMGVGILFVVNSLDSLTRLYTQNIGLITGARHRALHRVNWAILFALVLAFQFTPFKIEWVDYGSRYLYRHLFADLFTPRCAEVVPAKGRRCWVRSVAFSAWRKVSRSGSAAWGLSAALQSERFRSLRR